MVNTVLYMERFRISLVYLWDLYDPIEIPMGSVLLSVFKLNHVGVLVHMWGHTAKPIGFPMGST